MGNQRRSENTTPEQREFVRLFPGLSACLDSLAKDLDDADAVCKQQLEEGGRIPIPVPTLDQKSPAVVFVSVREAMLRSVDAPGDETVAAANKIIASYRDTAGTAAISCFDKMLSVAQGAGSVHTVAPPLAQEVRSHLSEHWEPANVLRLISSGGVLRRAFSPDDYDVDAYAKNQIRGPVLSRFDSHVQRLLNDATVEEAKATGERVDPALLRTQTKKADAELGRWADDMLRAAQVFARLVRAGKHPDSLRADFRRLFDEVIDTLYEDKRNSFFRDAQRRKLSASDLLDIIGETKELSGSRLNDIRKQYRRDSGLTRKHSIRRAPGTTRVRSRS